MKLESGLSRPSGLLHLAPIIDALVILLIFFLLGSNFVVQPGLAVTLPESSSQLSSFAGARVITVSAGSDPQIFVDGKECRLGSLGELLGEVGTGRRSAVLRIDELATYGVVVQVSSLLLESGYEIGLATSSPNSE